LHLPLFVCSKQIDEMASDGQRPFGVGSMHPNPLTISGAQALERDTGEAECVAVLTRRTPLMRKTSIPAGNALVELRARLERVFRSL
jgi:hypothetical protein